MAGYTILVHFYVPKMTKNISHRLGSFKMITNSASALILYIRTWALGLLETLETDEN